jgi:uncharacterized protein YggU (UPF0235/DUF167 family)
VRVTPRAGVDRIDGVGAQGELRVRLRAAPADGAANASLVRIIAEGCGVAPSRVRLEGGAASRTKRVSIDDLPAESLAALWPGLLTRPG